MSKPAPLVRFYDLSGPKPWSPYCWLTRYALNFKGIPYETVKISYPGIKPKCEELFGDMTGLKATVPIIEILQEPYKALNDSTPIAKLLNERFPEKDGYKELKLIDETDAYDRNEGELFGKPVVRWILFDVWANALDKNDGSMEFFKETREANAKMDLKDVMELKGGGEEKILETLRFEWRGLRERMSKEDGTGEPTYLDFYDAIHIKWIEGASKEKAAKVMNLYGDDTFTKLMKKVQPYSDES